MTHLEYLELCKELIVASESYYYAEPVMTDATYNEKLIQLQQAELTHPEWITKDSPTQQVGSPITKSKGFKKVKHKFPMLSLKTETDHTTWGAIAFNERITTNENTIFYYSKVKEEIGVMMHDYYLEPKFDGLGVDLLYLKGKLALGLTRGDGEYGEDITANIRMISDIPQTLKQHMDFDHPAELIIRGEILMFKNVLEELNNQRRLADKKEYVNTRNAAAGAVRQLDPLETKKSRLNFFAYTLVSLISDVEVQIRHSDQMQLLADYGFPICSLNTRCVVIDDKTESLFSGDVFLGYHDSINVIRKDLPYDIDGVVYKVDELQLQRRLGYTGREPVWAVAHKFPAEEKETLLESIDIQVGRTGKLTPVARLKPIFVGGVTVSNVTLHNEGEIKRKDVRVGEQVIVRRAGDVIPEIVGPFNPPIDRVALFTIPSTCPVCGSPVTKEEDEADYRCTGGLVCDAQRKQAIMHFTQRGAVEVLGLGESLIERLLEAKFISNVVDLYKLTQEDLLKLDRIDTLSANNLLFAIKQSKHTTLKKFIYALGIRHCGVGTAKRLVDHLLSIDKIINASMDELLVIKDIGPIVANSVFTFFSDKRNVDIITELLSLGIQWEEKIITPNDYAGKNIVITGTLNTLTRQQLKDRLEVLGANVQNSVGKSTDLLIAGPGGSTKLTDAQSLGITIIDEQAFLDSVSELTFHHF